MIAIIVLSIEFNLFNIVILFQTQCVYTLIYTQTSTCSYTSLCICTMQKTCTILLLLLISTTLIISMIFFFFFLTLIITLYFFFDVFDILNLVLVLLLLFSCNTISGWLQLCIIPLFRCGYRGLSLIIGVCVTFL